VYSKAQNGQPPSHPWFPYFWEQSTNCYSENDNKLLLLMKFKPSNEPVVENDQHDPHCPWFLIGVTAPLALQSTEAGNSPSFSNDSSVDSVEASND
jgi:hypothetical protein